MDKRELKRMFSAQPSKFYDVKILNEMGFSRKKCPVCEDWFWSIGKKTCGDTSCEGGYHFLGKTDLGWDFLTAIEKWERFFETHKHKVIEPYPVVARWRDDLYFVIASITDFQPWVLRGIAEPPGNPLVISQPCLRFNDLDNVGRTGRHLSLFFMGGQHSFNLQEYWMDETVKFGFKFLTNVMKIHEEEITYKEDVWSGGGNFGPSMEAFAHGLEIVNHVFMQFEETPHGYREMPMKVVDTGWGLERVAWHATGRPNTYEAIFPHVAKLRHDLGISIDFEDPFWSKLGIYDINEGVKIPKDVRKKLEDMKPLQDLYTILDHTRALSFAFADGAIPSNVGGGYNVRVLLRRVLGLIEANKFEISPTELIKNHAHYFSRRFKHMKSLPDVEDIVDIETARYDESRKRGEGIAIKYMKSGLLGRKLRELYESHGVSPEIVVDMAKKQGVDVSIPDDFYLKLSQKDSKREVEKESGRDLPDTKPLYYRYSPEDSFEAKVLWSSGKEVVLDQTIFYPQSGGQVHDTGKLEWKDKKANVVNVYREGKAVVHVLDTSAPHSNAVVKGQVNAPRRRDIMRNHTAVHLVNGAATKVLGKHVWQAGAEKTPEKARLDITHYKAVTPEQLREIERIANEVALRSDKIRKLELPRTEAEQRFGFRLYQGGAVPGAKLITINIPGHDAEACGGTHCDYASEVGQIKITDAKRIQDGVVRLEILSGMHSLERSWKNEDIIKEAAEVAKTKPSDLRKAITKIQIKIKRLQKTPAKRVDVHGKKVKWAIVDMPFKQMENSAKQILKQADTEAAVFVSKEGGVSVVSKGKISAVKLAKQISSKLGADAGGTDKVARGGAKDISKVGSVLKKLLVKFE